VHARINLSGNKCRSEKRCIRQAFRLESIELCTGLKILLNEPKIFLIDPLFLRLIIPLPHCFSCLPPVPRQVLFSAYNGESRTGENKAAAAGDRGN